MARAQLNGIEIEYETFGDRGGRPLLLIMGLGAQLLLWEEEFCAELVERGHFVTRYDNRDVGLSTKLAQAGEPNILEVMQAIPGAELLVIEGLGHELPPQVWPRVIDAISGHTEKAEAGRARSDPA